MATWERLKWKMPWSVWFESFCWQVVSLSLQNTAPLPTSLLPAALLLAMGIFGDPTSAVGVAATTYYKSGKGINFGGYCKASGCPSSTLAQKEVSECKGLLSGNPYAIATNCPACAAPFTPAWCWFYVRWGGRHKLLLPQGSPPLTPCTQPTPRSHLGLPRDHSQDRWLAAGL